VCGSRAPYRRLGRLVFTPSGIPFDVRGAGGVSVAATCTIGQDRFDRITGGIEWDDAILPSCIDIFGTSIESVLMRLVREVTEPGFASAFVVEAGGTLIAAELARFFRADTRAVQQKGRTLTLKQIIGIERFIEESEEPNLGSIATHCGVSVRSLTRNFRATTGRTISELIAESRVRRAKALLADRALPLKLVAHQSGFSSAGSFAVAFRRATGRTPGSYRRDPD
jgi:AraC family transcriptional regulator